MCEDESGLDTCQLDPSLDAKQQVRARKALATVYPPGSNTFPEDIDLLAPENKVC